MQPEICKSGMTNRWYIVTRRGKDGGAVIKYDVTDQIEEIIRREKLVWVEQQQKDWVGKTQ